MVYLYIFRALKERMLKMKKVSLFIVINAISLYVVSNLMDSMYIGSFKSLLILTIILGLLNSTVKPILKFLSFPITFLTLGLFSLVINALVLKLSFMMVSNVALYGFFSAIWASILLSIVNAVLYSILD